VGERERDRERERRGGKSRSFVPKEIMTEARPEKMLSLKQGVMERDILYVQS
jgi:hypothetical protein